MRSAALVFACLLGSATLVGGAAWADGPATSPTPPATLVPPRLLSEALVPYPAGAAGDATVLLTVILDEDGQVRSATAAEVNEPFSTHAVDAARGWRFEPATRNGKAIPAKIRVEVVFHARAQAAPEEATKPAPPTPTKVSVETSPVEVRVLGERSEPSRSVSLSRSEVRQIPGLFGDPFRAIEVMPGVTPIVSGLPFFFVRGAPPSDVGYFLDGVRVPYLFHVGAGPSVIHPALIDRVDLYPGGYPAKYGRFSGGIVSGEAAAPTADPHGEFNVRLFDAGAYVETPFAGGRGDVAIGGRYSYTAALLTIVQSNAVLDYWDYQARAGYNLTSRDRVSVFVFGAHDFLGSNDDGATTTLFDVTFHRADLRYDRRLDADGTLRVAFTGGIDYTGIGDGRYVEDQLAGARVELEQRLSPAALLRAGIDAEADNYEVVLSSDTDNSESSLSPLFPSRTDLALGTRADVVLAAGPRLEVTPGARVDFYASDGATAVGIDPRLGMRTVLTSHLRILSAMGIAHQIPAFVIPIPGFQPGGLQGGLQTAAQESAGIEADLDAATTMSATLYHNAFFNFSDALSVGQLGTATCGSTGAGTVFGGASPCPMGANPPPSEGAQVAQALETRSNGTAYGLEFFLKRRLTNRFGGLISYTLSRSVRTADNQTFVAPFDRTHVLNAAAAYDLGRGWRAGARVLFYTGLPKAPDPSDPGTRLAPFFRLDLRVEKRWQLGRRAWMAFVAEWQNATLSKEEVGTNCTLQGCQPETIGPVTIPSLGVEGGF